MDDLSTDHSGNSGSRSQKEREMDRKRARGEASCAECRRLKLKCDKKLPCSSCVRRGCTSICPNGTLATRQGNKYVLADTEKLHAKLLEMSRRIRQLEDALQIAQASLSSTPHPLLADELLSVKNGVDALENTEKDLSDPDWDIYTSFGTLTISERGETRFVGRSSSEALMAAVEREEWTEPRDDSVANKLPPDLAYLKEAFPFTPVHLPKEQIMDLVKERLPSYERATALLEAYLQHFAWFFRPVERDQIMEELIPKFYKRRNAAVPSAETGSEAHQLALLFGVFAAGAASDLTMESHNEEGELYRQLGRVALSLHSIFEGTSLATVQALALIAVYDFFSCSTQTLDSSWKMASMALCLASSIGLHWDPTSWNLDVKQIQRRRSVFWELASFDCWKSLASGRPAIFHMHEIDCRYPEDTDARTVEDGKTVPGFWFWKHDYAKNIISIIADRMCTVRPTKYSEILELDRKVRDYKIVSYREPDLDYENWSNQPGLLMMVLYREITLLFIHRNFFARAMQENPTNPVRSRFAPSFLSAYASSITIIRTLRLEPFKSKQSLIQRQWPVWAHALAAAVVIGTVAAKETPSELSRSALKELEHAIAFFDQMTQHPVVRHGLPILLRIREKARSKALSLDNQVPNPPPGVEDEDVDEALSIIGGATRFVRKVKHLRGSPSADTPSPPSSSDLPTPMSNNTPLPVTSVPSTVARGETPSLSASNVTTAPGLHSGSQEVIVNILSDPFAQVQQQQIGTPTLQGELATQQTRPPVSAINVGASANMKTLWVTPGQSSQSSFASFGVPTTGASLSTHEWTATNLASTDSYLNVFDFNAEFPDLVPSTDFLMGTGTMMDFDFDVGDGMSSDPLKASQLELQFADSTIAHAWHSILEDPRFANSGGGTGPF